LILIVSTNIKMISPRILDPLCISNMENVFLERSPIVKNQYSEDLQGECRAQYIERFLDNPNNTIYRTENILITLNKYPHQTPQETKLYVGWMRGRVLTHKEIVEEIEFMIKDRQYTLWINPLKHKSIPEVEHFHLLLRDNPIELRLDLVQIVSRHSIREPLIRLEKLNNSKWKCLTEDYETNLRNTDITQAGVDYAVDLYNDIYKHYFDSSQNIDLTLDLTLYSSNYQRTINTAKCFLDAMHTRVDNSINILDQLSMDGNDRLDGYKQFLKQPPREQHNRIIEKIMNVLGYGVQTQHDLYGVYSALECFIRNNVSLPDQWTHEDHMELQRISYQCYDEIFEQEKENMAGRLLELLELNSRVDTGVDAIAYPNRSLSKCHLPKCQFYSTHEAVLFPLLKLIRNDQYRIPDFCSMLIIEHYTHPKGKLIRYYYDSMLIKEIEI
jgi:hypothetical protein